MLIDAQIKSMTPEISSILSIVTNSVCGNRNPGPIRIKEGVYLINHFNPDLLLRSDQWEGYWNDIDCYDEDVSEYGVCDTPEQLLNISAYSNLLNGQHHKWCVFFTPVNKKDQPRDGGWRWNKWGPYEGVKKPTAEYLYDEMDIETVYCFHIFKRIGNQ